jgi:short-subunit dehydrogenase
MGKARARSEKPGTALITGASAGIGRELALVFAEHGHDLVIVSRTKWKLDALAEEIVARYGTAVTVIPADLTEPGAPERLFEELGQEQVDILVNNAGTGHFRPFADATLAEHLDVLQLNIVALTALAHLFVVPMIKRRRGRILNVASVAAFQPTPRFAVYGATKAYVLSLTESLVEELLDSGVTVTALCPGFTDTELVEHISEESGEEKLIPDFLMLDAPTVAREGYEACMAGTPVCVNGLTYQGLIWWERMQPRWLVRRVNGLLGRWYVGGSE